MPKSQIKILPLLLISLICISFFVLAELNNISIKEKLQDKDYQSSLRDKDSITEKDNKIKIFNSTEKRITIKDEKDEILIEFKFLSDYSVHVGASNDTKLFEFQLIDWKDGDELFDLQETFNIKDDYKKVEKEYWLKYGIDYEVEDCFEIEENISFCENVTKTNWTRFESLSELPYKDIKVSLWTSTIFDEKNEWVPIIKGFEILELATWETDSAIVNGLISDANGYMASSVFEVDGNFYLYPTNHYGHVGGYIGMYLWNGTGWEVNITYQTGFTDVGTDVVPEIFWLNDELYALFGAQDGIVYGFLWNGTSWNADSFINSGIVDVGGDSAPETFWMDDSFYLIVEGTSAYDGYLWNGTGWSVNAIDNGIRYDTHARIAVYNDSDGFHAVAGENGGGLWVYDWNGTIWAYNTVIGMFADVGTYSSPEIFEMEGVYYLIVGRDNDPPIFAGWSLTDSDSCTYASGNWEINLEDDCVIDSNTDLSTNNITFINTGTITFNATITACNIGDLPANQIGYLGSNAEINIGGCV